MYPADIVYILHLFLQQKTFKRMLQLPVTTE